MNTTNIIDVTELKKEIKKMEKNLERMKSDNLDSELTDVMVAAIEEKKSRLEALIRAKEAQEGKFDENTFLTFSVVDKETQKVTEKEYKVGFVKHNRPVDKKKVDGFIHIIANDKYEDAYPIIAIPAPEVLANGKVVTDTKGNIIKEEDSKDYLVILDGQHRTLAFLRCNMTAERVVPNTFIKTGIDIGNYIVDINDVGTSWNQQDRFAVAALVSDDELAHEIAARIDEGFSPSTASLIYTGKKIAGTQVNKLLRGEEWTLPEGAKTDIERGNKFIQLCKEANIGVKYIKKRHFINGFNAHALSVGEDTAFENLKKLKGHTFSEEELKAIKDTTDFVEKLATAS